MDLPTATIHVVDSECHFLEHFFILLNCNLKPNKCRILLRYTWSILKVPFWHTFDTILAGISLITCDMLFSNADIVVGLWLLNSLATTRNSIMWISNLPLQNAYISYSLLLPNILVNFLKIYKIFRNHLFKYCIFSFVKLFYDCPFNCSLCLITIIVCYKST